MPPPAASSLLRYSFLGVLEPCLLLGGVQLPSEAKLLVADDTVIHVLYIRTRYDYIRGESVLACRTLLPQHPPVKRYRCTRPCTAEVITVEDFAVLLFRSVSPLVSFFPDPLEAGRGDMLAHCVFGFRPVGSCPQARTSLPLWALAWFGSGSASPLHCQLYRQPSSALPLHPLVVCWCCHPPQPTSA